MNKKLPKLNTYILNYEKNSKTRNPIFRFIAQYKAEVFLKKVLRVMDNEKLSEECIVYNKDGTKNEVINSIYRFQYFLVQANADIALLSLNILKSRDKFLKKRLLRFLCTIVYEAIDDFDKIKGHEYIEAMTTFQIDTKDHLSQEFDRFKQYKKYWKNELYIIRNTIGAHRELNIQEFNNCIKSLHENVILELALIFSSILVCVSTYNVMELDRKMREIC